MIAGLLIVWVSAVVFPVVSSGRFNALVLAALFAVSIAAMRLARLPWIVGVSLPYLALMLAWGKPFAYVGLGPLYVTELYLALVAPLCMWWALRDSSSRPAGFVPWIAFVFFVLLKLVTAESFGMDALRNSVIGLYSVFYLIGWYLARDSNYRNLLLAACLVGVLVNLGPFFANVAAKNAWEQMRITGGNEIAAAFVMLFLLNSRWSLRRFALALLIPILGYQVLISYHRSLWLALFIGGLVILVASVWRQRSLRQLDVLASGLRMLPGMVAAVVLFLLTPWYLGLGELPVPSPVASTEIVRSRTVDPADQTVVSVEERPNALQVAFGKLASKLNLRQEGNATWRWWAWSTALDAFLNSPLFGISMDKPVLSTSYRGVPTDDPHNSFLAMLVRLGIVGFGLYLVFWGVVLLSSIRGLMKEPVDGARYKNGLFFLAAHVMVAIFAVMNVVLEGPHHGMLFWITMGLAAGTLAPESSSPGESSLALASEKL